MNDYGFYLETDIGKIGGELRYNWGFYLVTDKYNQNDLGYLDRNNVLASSFVIGHHIFKPFGIFLELHNDFEFNLSRLFKPSRFTEFYISYELSATLVNRYLVDMHAMLVPVERKDYWEAREPGRVFNLPRYFHNCLHITSDTRQPFWFVAGGGISKSYSSGYNWLCYSFSFSPSVRINDQLSFTLETSLTKYLNDLGYVDKDIQNNIIYFGKRDRSILESIIEATYIFTNRAFLNFRLRHYWSKVDYNTFYNLENNGELQVNDYSLNHDLSYNAFNIDLAFRWNFAPGSELQFSWKEIINTEYDEVNIGYWDNLANTLDAPQINSLSLKLLYYIDGSGFF